MRQRLLVAWVVVGLVTLVGLRPDPAAAEEFGGIEFPEGEVSFADAVASYDPVFDAPGSPANTDPEQAVGAPDDADVSLGNGGSIVLEFVDNALTGSGDEAPDLHIFESGGANEATFVEISLDGETFEDVGEVFGATSSIDIDAFGFGPEDRFFFVRLTDDEALDPQLEDERAGADIDAVGAISTVVEETDDDVTDLPDTGTGTTGGTGFAGAALALVAAAAVGLAVRCQPGRRA